MALTNGIETVGFVTMGYYTDEYTAADNVADLFCSYGLIEDVLKTSGRSFFERVASLIQILLGNKRWRSR